jgi:hypothetical protein
LLSRLSALACSASGFPEAPYAPQSEYALGKEKFATRPIPADRQWPAFRSARICVTIWACGGNGQIVPISHRESEISRGTETRER